MSLRNLIRAYLGTDVILHRLESTMAKVRDLLTGLIDQQTAASAAQASAFHNIDAAFDKLQAALDAANNGEADPDVQAAFDQLSAGFTALQTAAEDEGRSHQPTNSDTGEPATPPVLDGTDTPAPADGTTPDAPADGSDADTPAEGDTGRTNRR